MPSGRCHLIEAGTSGFFGLSTVIRKGVTQCYDCTLKPAPRTYPVCTIRSTPDQPVHCVVWAKELFKLLLGDFRLSYLFEENTSDGGAGSSAWSKSAYMDTVMSPPSKDDAQAVAAWARSVFVALFETDTVQRLANAPEVYAAAARSPVPIVLAEVEAGRQGSVTSSTAQGGTSALLDQRVLSLAESARLFINALTFEYSAASCAGCGRQLRVRVGRTLIDG